MTSRSGAWAAWPASCAQRAHACAKRVIVVHQEGCGGAHCVGGLYRIWQLPLLAHSVDKRYERLIIAIRGLCYAADGHWIRLAIALEMWVGWATLD